MTNTMIGDRAQMMTMSRREPDNSDDGQGAAIDAFIRTRGVTRCPTACLAATQATLDAADREALRRRWIEAEARRVPGFRQPIALAGAGFRDGSRPPAGSNPGAKGRATLQASADRFAASVMPIIETLRASGITGLGAIAAELNTRGIGAPRGGKWRGSAVRRLLARSGMGERNDDRRDGFCEQKPSASQPMLIGTPAHRE